MKVAVTGHTGFIGRNLVRKLESLGHTVYKISRDYEKVECDRVYHLACPSTSKYINENPAKIMDIILDGTRSALQICPSALFINASTKGVLDIDGDQTPQVSYNLAKRCMETYVRNSGVVYENYRIPSVYGIDMHDDMYVKRCVDGHAYYPKEPNKIHHIAHIDEVVDALVELREIEVEDITLGEIYELFSSGRRRIYRTTPDQTTIE